jgi:DNA-binding transcriptional ArsR family regulator
MVTQIGSPFAAISDPTRRAILDALRHNELAAGEIASLFTVSRPAVSKHLRVLRTAGLIKERKVAQSRRYTLNPDPLLDVERWLDHYRVFWAARLQDLKQIVESAADTSPLQP